MCVAGAAPGDFNCKPGPGKHHVGSCRLRRSRSFIDELEQLGHVTTGHMVAGHMVAGHVAAGYMAAEFVTTCKVACTAVCTAQHPAEHTVECTAYTVGQQCRCLSIVSRIVILRRCHDVRCRMAHAVT